MKYENQLCTVCGKKFTDDDTIVVCPKCGTPHHRECYDKLGHCVNQDKHNEGYIWKPSESTEKEVKKEAKKEVNNETQKTEQGLKSVPIDGKGQIKFPAGMPQEQQDDLLKMAGYRKIEPTEKIGEVEVREYGEYIDKNVHKYIPKFYRMQKTGSKLSWNWAAFLFPIPWLFYRKMAKIGILVALIIGIIPVVFASDFSNYKDDVFNVYREAILQDESPESVTEKIPNPPTAYRVYSNLSFVSHIFFGLFANYLYMKKCNKDINEIRRTKKDDTVYFESLKKKGRPSVGVMILAYATLMLILNVALDIASEKGMDLSMYVDKLIALINIKVGM